MDKQIIKYIENNLGEKVLEYRTCEFSGEVFPVFENDKKMLDELSPVINGEKYKLPLPTLSPKSRMIRRLVYRNINKLYKSRELDTDHDIVSPFSPDKGFNVLRYERWISDKIDAKDFGRDFDFLRSFFEQFNDLQKVAPRWDRIRMNSENCEWGINVDSCKNTYLVRSCLELEDGMYSERIFFSSDIYDSYKVIKSNNCYNIVYGYSCRDVFFGYQVTNVNKAALVYELENSSFCIGCVGLKGKKYYILNKEVSKQEFDDSWDKFFSDKSYREYIKKEFEKLKKIFPKENLVYRNSEKSFGNEIFNSKDMFYSFFIRDSENCRYIDGAGGNIIKSLDCSNPDYSEQVYESMSFYKLNKSYFCFNSTELTDCFYCETCSNLKNCFGCVGLKNAQYCILNKQYTKDEYFELVPKIISYMESTGEWGEFFPIKNSLFGYNESTTDLYFPLEKPEATSKGFNWSDYVSASPNVEKIIPATKLPDDINKIPDDILAWAIECEESKKAFRIMKKELEFYRKYNLEIPRKHPDIRFKYSFSTMPKIEFYLRNCDNCNKKILSYIASNSGDTVYCDECYNKEVY